MPMKLGDLIVFFTYITGHGLKPHVKNTLVSDQVLK